jgi:hypothetical protein
MIRPIVNLPLEVIEVEEKKTSFVTKVQREYIIKQKC